VARPCCWRQQLAGGRQVADRGLVGIRALGSRPSQQVQLGDTLSIFNRFAGIECGVGLDVIVEFDHLDLEALTRRDLGYFGPDLRVGTAHGADPQRGVFCVCDADYSAECGEGETCNNGSTMHVETLSGWQVRIVSCLARWPNESVFMCLCVYAILKA